jgi:hypothetical protein
MAKAAAVFASVAGRGRAVFFIGQPQNLRLRPTGQFGVFNMTDKKP